MAMGDCFGISFLALNLASLFFPPFSLAFNNSNSTLFFYDHEVFLIAAVDFGSLIIYCLLLPIALFNAYCL